MRQMSMFYEGFIFISLPFFLIQRTKEKWEIGRDHVSEVTLVADWCMVNRTAKGDECVP